MNISGKSRRSDNVGKYGGGKWRNMEFSWIEICEDEMFLIERFLKVRVAKERVSKVGVSNERFPKITNSQKIECEKSE